MPSTKYSTDRESKTSHRGFTTNWSSVPQDVWPSLRLTPAPCLRLLSFEFPVNDYFTAFRRGQSPEPPEPRATHLAITRRDFVVRRHTLNATQYTLLEAITTGARLGDAIVAAASQTDDFDSLSQSLAQWFSKWARDEFFVRLDQSLPLPNFSWRK